MENTFTIKLRYRGRLKNPASVTALILEAEDICRSNGWQYVHWDEDWSEPASLHSSFDGSALHFDGHAPLKGISFGVGPSETIWLTFTPDGILQSLMTLVQPDFTGDAVDMPWQRVKTGFDGVATHLAICKLFRYLAGKYFEVFEVQDESGYWAHGDDARFAAWFAETKRSFHQFMDELERLHAEDLSKEEHGERMRRLADGFRDKLRAGG
jgi:hypothetical protein